MCTQCYVKGQIKVLSLRGTNKLNIFGSVCETNNINIVNNLNTANNVNAVNNVNVVKYLS